MLRTKNILILIAVVSIAFASCSKLEPLKEVQSTESTNAHVKAMSTSGDETGNGITDPDHDEDHDKDNASIIK